MTENGPLNLEELVAERSSGSFLAPAAGSDFDYVVVEYGLASDSDAVSMNVMLAPLRKNLGIEVELTAKEERILHDPKSAGGSNIAYIEKRARFGYGPLTPLRMLIDKIVK